jgi:uncharacterized protein (UPF0335 family)
MTKNSKKIKEFLKSIEGLEKEKDAIDRRIKEIQKEIAKLVEEDSKE